jgi:cell division transport system ATP-binding protein
MIQFKNIHKSFGLTEVIHDLNLTIKSGELIALIGPSGVGKSTLLHLLIGALKPDNGNITIDNIDVTSLSGDNLQLLRRSMGMVFQDCKLLPQKTVFENVAFALEVCGSEPSDIETKVPTALQRIGISSIAHKFPHELSGGEQQKVAIARALVHEPSLVIADELTGNLDPHSAAEIAEILQQLHHDGLTILIATHDKDLVNTLKPRVILLKNGDITKDVQQSGFLSF